MPSLFRRVTGIGSGRRLWPRTVAAISLTVALSVSSLATAGAEDAGPPAGAEPAATQSAAPSLAALPVATAEEPAGPVATVQPEAIEDEGAAAPEVPAEVSPPAADSSAGEEPGIASEQPVVQEPEDPTSEPEPAPELSPDQPGTETENWAGQAGPGDALLPDIGAFSLATTTCSYATGGTAAYTNTLCWLDMEGLTTEYVNRGTAQNPNWQSILGDEYTVPGSSGSVPAPGAGYYGELQNVPITVSLRGGYTLFAKIDITGTVPASGTTRYRSRQVRAVPFPTWSGAYLGNGNFYPGTPGYPAIYQGPNDSTPAAVTTINLKDIYVTNASGEVITGYSVVVADAESTDSGERIDWVTTGQPFRWLPNTPGATNRTGTMGNACPGSHSPVAPGGSSSTASCVANASSTKTGTPMLQSAAPADGSTFAVTQTMTGNGLQGVAFGVIVSGAKLNVNVISRIVDQDGDPTDTNFTGRMTRPGGDPVDIETGGDGDTASGEHHFPIDGAMPITFASAAEQDEVSSSYVREWFCQRTTPGGTTTRWPATGYSLTPPTGSNAAVGVGEFLECTVQYRPPTLTLAKSINVNGQSPTSTVNVPGEFTLNADGSLSSFSGTTGIKRAVAAGVYDLSEIAPPVASASWKPGYIWTNLSCTGATAQQTKDGTRTTGATVTIQPGTDGVCTYTNTANANAPATVVVYKNTQQADGSGQAPAGGWTVGVAFRGTNTGRTLANGGNQTTRASDGRQPNVTTITHTNTYRNSLTNLNITERQQTGYQLITATCTITERGGRVREVVLNTTQSGVTITGRLDGIAAGESVACTFVNKPIAGSVSWEKVSATADPAHLGGSSWKIVGPSPSTAEIPVTDCVAEVATMCVTESDKDHRAGYFNVPGLPLGTYDLIEVRPPVGYLVDPTPHGFVVNANNLHHTFASPFENAPRTGPSLPLTGGLGRDFYTLLGLGVIGLAAGGFSLSRMRSRRVMTE